MPWTRASELDRTLHCPGSLLIPRNDGKSERAAEAADWGTMGHRWKATGEVRAEPGRSNHERLFLERLDATGVDRLALWPADGRHELSVAVNVLSWRVESADLPDKEAQDAWKATFDDEWVTGTMDYLGSLLGDPWVDDYKSGAWPVPVETWQLDYYGLAAWLLRGRPDVVRLTITQWSRYPKAGRPSRLGRVLTHDDCTDFMAFLASRHRDYLTARGKTLSCSAIPIDHLVPGEWCRFCPSRGLCPAYDKEILNGP